MRAAGYSADTIPPLHRRVLVVELAHCRGVAALSAKAPRFTSAAAAAIATTAARKDGPPPAVIPIDDSGVHMDFVLVRWGARGRRGGGALYSR